MIKTKTKILISCIIMTMTSLSYYGWLFSSSSNLDPSCMKDARKQILDEQLEHANRLNRTITAIKKIALSKSSLCSNNKSKEISYELIISGGYSMSQLIVNILEANANSYQIFDEKIAAKVESLVQLLQQNSDYCGKDFPSIEKLADIQKDINVDMDKYISATKQKIGS